jgi:ABC-2 type transport system permease protein
MNTLYWLVKREMWENRGGFLWAPLVAAIVFLITQAVVLSTGHVVAYGDARFALDVASLAQADPVNADRISQLMDVTLLSGGILARLVMSIALFFYLVGSLYDDRRDRSVLFWKSLPVSDAQTVTSKVLAALLVAPLIVFAISVVTGLLAMGIFTLSLAAHGVAVGPLLAMTHPLKVVGFLLAVIPLYLLWALPSAGWLMLCSAWARSRPFLWAVLPPIIAFATVNWLITASDAMPMSLRGELWKLTLRPFSVLPSGWPSGVGLLGEIGDVNKAAHLGQTIANGPFMGNDMPSAWNLGIGAAIGLALLFAATRLRRWRTESSD